MQTNTQIIEQWLEGIKQDIIDGMYAQKRVASRRTIKSLTITASEFKGTLTGLGSIIVNETGRKPGGMPPIEVIQEWLKDKGLSSKLNAWAVAKSMAKKGSVLFRQGGKSGILSGVITDQRIDVLLSAFGTKYMEEYSSDIIRFFEESDLNITVK